MRKRPPYAQSFKSHSADDGRRLYDTLACLGLPACPSLVSRILVPSRTLMAHRGNDEQVGDVREALIPPIQ
jgi:hypothetical protein